MQPSRLAILLLLLLAHVLVQLPTATATQQESTSSILDLGPEQEEDGDGYETSGSWASPSFEDDIFDPFENAKDDFEWAGEMAPNLRKQELDRRKLLPYSPEMPLSETLTLLQEMSNSVFAYGMEMDRNFRYLLFEHDMNTSAARKQYWQKLRDKHRRYSKKLEQSLDEEIKRVEQDIARTKQRWI